MSYERHWAGALSTVALILALAPAAAAAQQHHHHEDPAAKKPQAKPVAKPAETSRTSVTSAGAVDLPAQRVVQNGVVAEFTVGPASPRPAASDTLGADAPPIRAAESAIVRVALSDEKTGRPLVGAAPAAWIDLRTTRQPTDAAACKVKVDKYVQASTNMEQSLKARAVVDLNSYFVLTLNRAPLISVLDPFLGFGRTKMYTTVLLKAEGEDWKLSGDQHRLYVSMPRVGQVAVVNTDNWKVIANVDVGPSPTRLAIQPDERYVWVSTGARAPGDSARPSSDSLPGVTVIDRAAMTVASRIPTGAGPHLVEFSADSKLAFVLNKADQKLTVVDVERLAKVKDIKLGPRPTAIAYSPVSNAVYVVDEQDGTVAVVDGKSLSMIGLIKLAPGLRTIRFAPMTGSGHGAHGAHAAHGADANAAAGRLGFVLNPRRNAVTILDARTNRVVRTIETGVEPDQVAFTTSFAYIRSAGSPEVAMIPLADPSAGGAGDLDKFPAGGAAPRAAGQLSEADAIVAAPDMPDAVYVLNPKERMAYYFHYMEGMPIPSGGLTTYGFDPKAVLVAGKDLRETEPGVYQATIKLDDRGDYDFIFLLDDPRVIHCFQIGVGANPALNKGKSAIGVTPLSESRRLAVGRENVLRFRLVDIYTNVPRPDLKDVGFILTATSGWRQRGVARPVGDGEYEVSVTVPAAGVYYLSFEIPSVGMRFNDRSPVIYRAVR